VDLLLRLVTQIALSNRMKMWSLRKFLRKSILWFLIAGGVNGLLQFALAGNGLPALRSYPITFR